MLHWLKTQLPQEWTRKHWLLFGLAGGFVISLVYNIHLAPQLDRQTRLESQRNVLLPELQQLEQFQMYENRFREQATAMHEQMTFLETVLPLRWHLSAFTAQLLQASQSHQLDLVRQSINPEILYEHYAELRVNLELKGTYSQLLSFVDTLNDLPVLLTIHHLRVHNPTVIHPKPDLLIKMDLRLYRRLVEETEDQTVQSH